MNQGGCETYRRLQGWHLKKPIAPKRLMPSVHKEKEAPKEITNRRHVVFQMAVVLPESQSGCPSGVA